MSLLALQRGLKAHILASSPSIAGELRGDPTEGLAVYHNAYRAQLLACLRDTFEKTWAWLGDEAFDAAAKTHIAAHPPSSWTLDDYGADFIETLQALYPDDPEVGEIAWLDWSLRRAFDGPDADAMTQEALAAVDWDAAVLRLAPTLTVSDVATNAAALWGAIAAGQTPPAAQRLPAPGAVRVWRRGLSPQYRTIDGFERRALALVGESQTFGDVCAAMAEGQDEAQTAQAVGVVMGAWIQDGLITSVDYPPSPEPS